MLKSVLPIMSWAAIGRMDKIFVHPRVGNLQADLKISLGVQAAEWAAKISAISFHHSSASKPAVFADRAEDSLVVTRITNPSPAASKNPKVTTNAPKSASV